MSSANWKGKYEELAAWYLTNRFNSFLVPSAQEKGVVLCLELALTLARGVTYPRLPIPDCPVERRTRAKRVRRRLDFTEAPKDTSLNEGMGNLNIKN